MTAAPLAQACPPTQTLPAFYSSGSSWTDPFAAYNLGELSPALESTCSHEWSTAAGQQYLAQHRDCSDVLLSGTARPNEAEWLPDADSMLHKLRVGHNVVHFPFTDLEQARGEEWDGQNSSAVYPAVRQANRLILHQALVNSCGDLLQTDLNKKHSPKELSGLEANNCGRRSWSSVSTAPSEFLVEEDICVDGDSTESINSTWDIEMVNSSEMSPGFSIESKAGGGGEKKADSEFVVPFEFQHNLLHIQQFHDHHSGSNNTTYDLAFPKEDTDFYNRSYSEHGPSWFDTTDGTLTEKDPRNTFEPFQMQGDGMATNNVEECSLWASTPGALKTDDCLIEFCSMPGTEEMSMQSGVESFCSQEGEVQAYSLSSSIDSSLNTEDTSPKDLSFLEYFNQPSDEANHVPTDWLAQYSSNLVVDEYAGMGEQPNDQSTPDSSICIQLDEPAEQKMRKKRPSSSPPKPRHLIKPSLISCQRLRTMMPTIVRKLEMSEVSRKGLCRQLTGQLYKGSPRPSPNFLLNTLLPVFRSAEMLRFGWDLHTHQSLSYLKAWVSGQHGGIELIQTFRSLYNAPTRCV